MIFYFTGTGNSRWVAEALRKALEEPLVSIVEVLTEEKSEYVYPLGEREKVIFVFPVHSWGPAVLVTRLISRLRLENPAKKRDYLDEWLFGTNAEQLCPDAGI